MTILHTETHDDGATVIEVGQEWEQAGLFWRVTIENALLGAFKRQSSGRYYMDQNGERIHGATIDNVIARAASDARKFLKIA